MQNGFSLPTAMTIHEIGGSVKHQAAKRSLQRPMNNQILDYQVMLNVCKEEMSKIKFFGIIKETMDKVHKSLKEWFSRFACKLSSEDKSHAGTHDFNLPTTFRFCDIRPMTYVTCLYDSFWWVGLVTQVDVEQGDVKVQFKFPHEPHKTFNTPETEIHAMCQSKTFFVRYLSLPQRLDELIR